MKIAGEATLRAPVERVYAALHDPAVLVRTIPGCERLEQVGADAYAMTVTAGVAAIKGTYTGSVALTEHEEPHGFVLTASGSGAPGTVSAEARVRLAGDGNGGTTLTYDADAVVGGMVGGVGQRILVGAAKRTANEFFAAVDDALAAVPTPMITDTPGTPGYPEFPRSPEGTAAVYTRPAAPRRALPGGDFAAGVVVGALAALAGAVVGGLLARRSSPVGGLLARRSSPVGGLLARRSGRS